MGFRLFSQVLNGDLSIFTALGLVLITVPIILVSLTVHEVMHGLVSYKLGDPTAMNYGRLTLNPIKHLDPFGTVCMLVFGFGWAKPVPINSGYYKNTRLGITLTALAGPLSNFTMAFIAVPFMLLIGSISGQIETESINVSILAYPMFYGYLAEYTIPFATKLACTAFIFFDFFVQMNIMLGIFNMLPIPPLDGSRILLVFLPQKAYYFVIRIEMYIKIGLLILLYTGVLSRPLSFLNDGIYEGFVGLWSLIPGLG